MNSSFSGGRIFRPIAQNPNHEVYLYVYDSDRYYGIVGDVRNARWLVLVSPQGIMGFPRNKTSIGSLWIAKSRAVGFGNPTGAYGRIIFLDVPMKIAFPPDDLQDSVVHIFLGCSRRIAKSVGLRRGFGNPCRASKGRIVNY
ncbi:hypothetical protein HYR99_02825 [Candidatus Poribacteria bacterium]|nr:hypothetical protein [Candidatus Poribacteria bacterium]